MQPLWSILPEQMKLVVEGKGRCAREDALEPLGVSINAPQVWISNPFIFLLIAHLVSVRTPYAAVQKKAIS